MTPIPAPKRIRQSAPTIHNIGHRQSIQLVPSTFANIPLSQVPAHAKPNIWYG